MKDKKLLENSIIKSAISGKLTNHNLNDKSVFGLIDSIHTEHMNLLKSNKITKHKGDNSLIFKNNFYFLIENGKEIKVYDEIVNLLPSNWSLITQKELFWLENGVKTTGKHLPILDAKFLRTKQNPSFSNSGVMVTPEDKVILVDGENSGEVFTPPCEGYLGSTFKILKFTELMNFDFLLLILKSNEERYKSNKTGMAIPHLNKILFRNDLALIPPLEEQERIVAKIKKLQPLLNEYEKSKRDYDIIDSNLVMKLRLSVIKAAIEGGLTSHNLNDMSAFDLVKSIKKEHINLLSIYKIRKQKRDCDLLLKNGLYTLVTNGEEIPVDSKIINSLPKNWGLITQKELFWLDNGVKTSGESLPILDADYLRTNQDPTFGTSGVIVTPNDKVILVDGNAGEVFTPPCKGYMGSTFKILKFTKLMNYDFLLLILKSSNGKYKNHQIIPHLDKVSFRNDLVMIPPLEEQERIVAKANEVLNKIDNF